MEWSMSKLCYLLGFILISICDGSEDVQCDFEMFVDPTADEDYTISSPGYPNVSYTPGLSQTWCISSPEKTSVLLKCDLLDIPKSADCEINALTVLSDGDDSRAYCGSAAFQAESSSNEMTVKLHSSKKSRGGRFFCQVTAERQEDYSVRAIVYDDCDCGYSYKTRIVGGEETGINEYPFMAGLIDARRGAVIVCGASIISPKYVITVNHCLGGLVVEQTGVVVGEHNVATGSETTATKLIKAKRFIQYPYYNSNNQQYDISLIELASTITYSARVGPVCLPFTSRNWDLTGRFVTVLGWGTTEFGGPRSKYLQKAYVDLVDINNCINAYGSDIEPYTQLCAYRQNSDACQYDSGGPLLFFNSNINRYELVGLISYGRGCASNVPSVNTKVAPFLQWILDNTQTETYCYKSS